MTGKFNFSGWNKFQFIISPEEFKELFSELEYSFIETGSRVEKSYLETNKLFVFKGYYDFVEEILLGDKELSRQDAWNIERVIRTSVIDDLQKVTFEDIYIEGEKIEDFKRTIVSEPVINIAPFYLHIFKDKPTTRFFNKEGVIGLEFSYPKIAYADEQVIFKTELLYDRLVKQVKSIANKAKIEKDNSIFKVNFWISDNARMFINKNKYLKNNNLIIK